MAVAIDTTPLTPEQRLQLPLLMATAFKLPCAADGAAAALSKDDFVAALQADTVRYACDTGCIKGGSSQLLTFFVQVELDGGSGLEVALKWIRRALYLTQLTPELLGIAVKRELSQIPAAVRNGSGVMSALSWLTNYTDADNDLNGCATLSLTPYRQPAQPWATLPASRAPPGLLRAECEHTCVYPWLCPWLAPQPCTERHSRACAHPSRQVTPSASSPSSSISRRSSARARAAPPRSPRSPRCAPCCSSRSA